MNNYKKVILLLLLCIMHIVLCVEVKAQGKAIVLFEDFEGGMPSEWVQDKIFGNTEWVVESGDLRNPNGAVSGEKRLAFRNDGNQTTGDVTRLVLPQMDLSGVFHPILSFSYAQPKWAGDVDTLRVLYRRSPNSKWMTLITYADYSEEWKRDTIRLVAMTNTYQIAFEAKDNLGRGVVIDDVEVRSMPNCTQPFNLMVSKIRGSSVRLDWAGSFDALKYRIELSVWNEELREMSDTKVYEIDGAEYSFEVTGLKQATEYCFRVQSLCVGEESEWSDMCYFRTAEMIDMPYVENFDMPYVENAVSMMSNLFCYSSKNAAVPFVNTDHLKSKRLLYSQDSTTALFFNGAKNVVTPIAKGEYVYAAIPEVNVNDISRLQVSFWTINNFTVSIAAEPAVSDFCRILVGVMTDPSDKNTFVAVDTVEITTVQEFEEVIVSFENYKGNGKFIAFMSDFVDGTNAFVLDDVVVDYIPTMPKAQVQVGLPASDAVDVYFVENESERYEVIVANAELDVTKIDDKKVVARGEFDVMPCRLQGLKPWVNYFVYGRHLNSADTGAWSNAVKILTPDSLDAMPQTISFDINTFNPGTYYTPGKSTYQLVNGVLAISNHDKYPMSTNAYWTEPSTKAKARSEWEMSMTALFDGDYQIAIFPEIKDPSRTKVSFYATRHLRFYLGDYSVVGTCAVGIMSDANDVESFVAIDTIVLNETNSVLDDYESYEYDLSNYDLTGKFFAIKTDFAYAGASMIWIDDVRFTEASECEDVLNVKSVAIGDEVELSWDDNGATEWAVIVSATNYLSDELDGLSENDYFVKETTVLPTIKIDGLDSGEKTYYYYIQSKCNGVWGAWSLPNEFTTSCLNMESVPYKMNFDDKEWVASPYLNKFEVPCLFTVLSQFAGAEPGEVYYYPHLTTANSTTGEKSMVLASSNLYLYDSYVALPQMDVEIKQLQVSFDMKSDSLNQVVEVGVMSDPLDKSTFVAIKTVNGSVDWKHNIVRFVDYVGSGKYIAIRTAGATNMNYIDNIEVDYLTEGGDDDDNTDPKPEDPDMPKPDCTPKTTYELGCEGFEIYRLGVGSAPYCYTVGNLNDTAPAQYIPYCSDEYAYSGSASLCLSSTALYNSSYAITPEINIRNISNLRVRFRASVGKYYTSQYEQELTVAIVTDLEDLSAKKNIKTIKIYPNADLEYEVRFDEYTGDYNGDYGRYVMFMSYSAMSSNVVFVDDVVFDTIPTCVSPKVEVVEEGSTIDKLNLRLYDGEAPYELKYIVGDYSEAALEAASVIEVSADGSFEISGLDPNSDCFVIVRSKCGDEMSEWSTVQWFRTGEKTKVTLPYYDSFSQNNFVGEYNNPLDWTSIYTSSDLLEQYRFPYVSEERGGDKVVYLYADATTETSYMATPCLDVDDLSKCQVSFNYRPDTDSYRAQRAVVVGVATDASSKAKVASTFKAIDTILVAGTTDYKQYVVSLANYSGKAQYVVFKADFLLNKTKQTDKDGAYGGGYIDDVLVEMKPICERPIDFKLIALGDTYAEFKFNHDGADKYEVEIKSEEFGVRIEETKTNKFIIDKLTPNTEYEFRVRAYCSDTDISDWSIIERYTTFEVPVKTFPYENRFDDAVENKLWYLSTNSWYANDSLYVSSDGGASASYGGGVNHSWAYRTFDMTEGVYTLSFDWKVQGDEVDYMRVMLIPALSTFDEGSGLVYNFDGTKVELTATHQSLPKDWIDLNRNGLPFHLQADWNNYSSVFMITPEIAGFYRLVVYWENDNKGEGLSAVIDNLIIEKSSCNYPYKFEIEDINSTYLTLSWTPVGGTPEAYNVVALKKRMNPDEATDGYVASRSTVTEPIAKIEGLESNTSYYIYVQSDCGRGDVSYWSDSYEFTTPCDPKSLGTVFSFESEEGYYLPNYDDGEANSNYRVPDCFVVGHSNSEEVSYIKDNTLVYPHAYRSGIKQMARTGDYAMRFYYNSEEKVGGYASLPLIDGDFNDLQVSFWMRPFAAIKNPQGDNVDQEGLNKIFARKITVGTMTNPDDPSTFEALRVVAYPYSNEDAQMATGQLVMDDVENTDYWRKYSVILKGAKGKFITFKNELYDGCEYNQMYIDDVEVDFVSDCMTPSGPLVEAATATTALLNAETNGGSSFEIQISTIEDFSSIWRTDTVTAFPVNLKNLDPGQSYYMRIRTICGATNYSDWSSMTNCITAYSVLYSSDDLGVFETASYSPRHWQRACGTSAADIFSKAGSAMTTDASSPLGWRVKDGHLATYVAPTQTRETNPYCWMFSSSIELPEGDVTMLFNLALTDADGVHRADSTVNNKNDKFYVVISEDNGRSWEEHNKVTWTNDGKGDYDYNSIPFEGRSYSVDLSKYAGKVIRFAFYSECTTPSVSSELHINNIHINSVIRKNIESVICETEDYQFDAFKKLSSELNIGRNNLLYHKQSKKIGVNDSIFDISLNVRPLSIKTIDAAICVGDVYSANNFNNITRSGVYKQKIASANGCDSIVVLNLQVNPIQEKTILDTICFGGIYVWNGNEYTRSGRYIDTLVSVVTGCDSIAILLLSVDGAAVVNDTIDLCSGQIYMFGGDEITESGEYSKTFETISGCDSVVNLVVNVADDFRLVLNEFICKGETYSGHGFKGVPKEGTYTLPLKSVGGCDSTIVLNLYELDDDTIYVEQKITLDQLPYTFVSKTYGKDTELGIYTDEFFIEREGCSSVVVLKLEVGESVNVEDVVSAEWLLYPNPMQAGEMLYIEGNFSQEELDGMQIEIYTMLGSCIYSSQFSVLGSQLSIEDRGLYIVRLIAGNGNVYQSKVIVQ